MYILYISSTLILFYSLSYCICNKKKVKKFDYKETKKFELKDIYFYKNNELIKIKKYDKTCDKQKFLEFNLLSYDYFVIEYLVNNKLYKYLSNSTSVKFPFYFSDNIKNYVYINNIVEAKLLIKESNDEIKTIDITDQLIPFLGPNYNFYNDLGLNMKTKLIINYILLKKLHAIKSVENKKYQLKLYDNFSKEYNIGEYIEWNPNLQL